MTVRTVRAADELRSAISSDEQWIWLVAPGVEPAPDALDRLLEAASSPDLPAPVLLSSKVVGPHGLPVRAALPIPQVMDPDLATATAARRLLSIRVARWGSLLVRRDAAAAVPAPDSSLAPFEDLVWTARLLRDGPGYLVPSSVAVAASDPLGALPAGERNARELRARAAMLRGDALEPREKAWFLFALAERGLRALRLPRSA